MKTKKGKTVFIEYSTNEPKQHFITVVQTADHKRITIGRIFREYDQEAKKTNYYAVDHEGNRVFMDFKGLYEIKQQFKEHGERMAMSVPAKMTKERQAEILKLSIKKDERKNEIKNLREMKTEKVKAKDNQKHSSKKELEQMEKVQDDKNPEKHIENEKNKEGVFSENIEESNFEEQIFEEPENEFSQREAELDNIRGDNEDREQDLEMDI